MTPETMRKQAWARILKMAEDAGWQAVVEIKGYSFEAYLTAEGACEQFIEGKLSETEQILTDLGEPDLYPAVEEYATDEEAKWEKLLETIDAEGDEDDVSEPVEEYDLSTEADNELTEEIVEEYLAAGEAEVIDVSEALCEECPLSETKKCLEGPPAPCDALHEDVHDHDEHRGPLYLDPKELRQAAQVKDQDRGGIPRPNQYEEARMLVEFNGEQYVAPEGHHIEARKVGFKARQYGHQVNEAEKQRMVVDHWFFYAVENRAKETLLAGGTITVQGRRFVASEGHRIVARKGDMYFEALSLDVSYQKSGWVLSVTQ